MLYICIISILTRTVTQIFHIATQYGQMHQHGLVCSSAYTYSSTWVLNIPSWLDDLKYIPLNSLCCYEGENNHWSFLLSKNAKVLLFSQFLDSYEDLDQCQLFIHTLTLFHWPVVHNCYTSTQLIRYFVNDLVFIVSYIVYMCTCKTPSRTSHLNFSIKDSTVSTSREYWTYVYPYNRCHVEVLKL